MEAAPLREWSSLLSPPAAPTCGHLNTCRCAEPQGKKKQRSFITHWKCVTAFSNPSQTSPASLTEVCARWGGPTGQLLPPALGGQLAEALVARQGTPLLSVGGPCLWGHWVTWPGRGPEHEWLGKKQCGKEELILSVTQVSPRQHGLWCFHLQSGSLCCLFWCLPIFH